MHRNTGKPETKSPQKSAIRTGVRGKQPQSIRHAGIFDILLVGVSGCLAFLLCATNAVGAPKKGRLLRYGEAYSAMQSVYSLPIVVAQRQGYFVQEGLDFQIVLVSGDGSSMIDALDHGGVDLGHVATPYLIQGSLAGSDVVAIASEFANPIYSLMAKPEIASVGALAGHTIALADPGSVINEFVRRALQKGRLRGTDVTLKTISGTPERLACLEHGACDAAPLGQPEDFTALSKGYRRLALTTDVMPPSLYTVTAARRRWARAHPRLVEAYIRALARAFRFIRDPSHREEVVHIMATAEGSERDARATLKLYFDPDRHVLPIAGEIQIAALQQVLQWMFPNRTAKALPDAGRFVDLDFLRAIGAQ
jgi:ABC-type nitrate/sulfonate/bicarbonate transport system substrate-binding protein